MKFLLKLIPIVLVLLLLPGIAEVKSQVIAPGVEYLTIKDKTNVKGEPLTVYALKVDKNARDVEIMPVMAGNRIGDTRRVSQMAEEYGAVGAINGVFYHSSGGRAMPVGNIVIDGNPLAIFDYYRTSIAFTRKPDSPGKLETLLGHFTPTVTIETSESSIRVNDINSLSGGRGVHLYTHHWGGSVSGDSALNAVFTPTDEENMYELSSLLPINVTVPKDGFVLRFIGENYLAKARELTPGQSARYNFSFDKDFWGDIEHLLTAGPLLVEGGEPVFQSIQEGFTGSILRPNTRSAMGVTSEGELLMVVAEAAAGGGGSALTFEEMALLMADLGAEKALGLDGGGSSTLYVKDRVVNRNRTNERAIPQAFMVLVGPGLYLNGERIYPDVPPQIKDDRVLVPLRIIMENLQARVDWDKDERKVTITRKDSKIELFIDEKEAYVDGASVQLDVPPIIHGDRTLVPIRFVSETLKGHVQWDHDTRRVYITMEE